MALQVINIAMSRLDISRSQPDSSDDEEVIAMLYQNTQLVRSKSLTILYV